MDNSDSQRAQSEVVLSCLRRHLQVLSCLGGGGGVWDHISPESKD